MKNLTLSIILICIGAIFLGSCGSEKKTQALQKRNFLINDGAENQMMLWKDFQIEDYNEEAPDHDHRTEVVVGSVVEFKNISEPAEKIEETAWYVYPLNEKKPLNALAKENEHSYTFSEEGNFVVQMTANGKDIYKVIRVIAGDGLSDADGDGVADSVDNCPDEFGDATAKGCPDTDGDGIADKADDCPNEYGDDTAKGCPDSDRDGIADAFDNCPNKYGKSETNGCPPESSKPKAVDTDNDGIADSKDKCPAEPGKINTKGCPDDDGDGVANSADKCPDVKGSATYDGCLPPDEDNDGFADDKDRCPSDYGKLRGCPDKDKDGIADIDDDCPDEPGKSSSKGCPVKDRDNDGIADNEDECPDEAGSAATKGCPIKDSDNDGVADAEDLCPNDYGKLRGCPDDDNDGIANNQDKCPNKAGNGSADGCPVETPVPAPPKESAVRSVAPPTTPTTNTASNNIAATKDNDKSSEPTNTITKTTPTPPPSTNADWYPTQGTAMVGVPYNRCADSHSASQWESNKTTMKLLPTTKSLLKTAKIYASNNGKLRLELKGAKGGSAKTIVSVNRGSTDLPLDDLDIVMQPGETYYLSITPQKSAETVLKLDNIANCNPSPKTSPNMTVEYENNKMVLFNLKFDY